MTPAPRRSSVSIRFADDVTIDPARIIPLFHDWIRHGSVPGLLVDVADYRHVGGGPAVVLVGHDVDYSIDRSGGGTALTLTRKRPVKGDLSDDLRRGLRSLLAAARVMERGADPHPPVRFRTDEIRVQMIDRLHFRHDAGTVEAVRDAIAPLFTRLFDPAGVSIESDASDPRMPVTLRVRASAAPPLGTLVARL
jgi:hypothetical protein